jgi:DNA-binding LacI/PurR family transcriptional regulator
MDMNSGNTPKNDADVVQNQNRSQNARHTIGYLANSISQDNDRIVWPGLLAGIAAAREHKPNLICFPGRRLADPKDDHAQANIIFELASAQVVDGLISWATTVGTYVSRDEIENFLERYRPLPIALICGLTNEYPSLWMDGYAGVRAAIMHLFQVHGRCRIAFIRGPESSLQAQDRYRAYTETMAALDLPLDERLITPPHDWDRATGMEAMRVLLDERQLRPRTDFDAIVGSNDELILGALEVMHSRGIKVPGDVAVVGFDNGAECKANTPPLTTVAAPFFEMGYQSVEMLMEMLLGKPVESKLLVPQLAIRQSCGCVDPTVAQAVLGAPANIQYATLESALAEGHVRILALMTQALGETLGPVAAVWTRAVLDAFVADLQDASAGLFLQRLDEILCQVLKSGGDVWAWQNAISVLRQQTAPLLNSAMRQRAEDLWHQARVMIGEVEQRAQAQRAIRAAQRAQTLREIEVGFLTTFDVSGLMDELAKYLPRLGINSCYLALYENPQPYKYPQAVPEWSRLMLAYTEKGRVELDPGGRRFRSRELVPEGLWPQERQYAFVVEPLYFQEQQLGFVLFELDPQESAMYENLRSPLPMPC